MVYNGYRRKRGGRRPKRRVYRKRGGLGVKAVRTIAKEVAKEGRETKFKQYDFLNYSLAAYNVGALGGSANSLTRICLTPQNYTNTPASALTIPVGAGSDERIGNKIEMCGGELRMMFNAAPYDATNNPQPEPQIVQVFIGYDKTQAHGIPLANFPDLYTFNDLAISPTGQILDTFRKINTARYVICYRRTVKIGYSGYTGANNQSGQQYFENNDFKYSRKVSIDFTKRMLKNVKFSEDADLVPNGRQLWAWFQVINPYGATGVGRPIELHAECVNKFKDA